MITPTPPWGIKPMDRPTLDDLIEWTETCATRNPVIVAPHMHAALRRLKAVEEALKTYDSAVALCPVRKSLRFFEECPDCWATTGQGCGADDRASYTLIQTIRATLTETPNDQ